MSDPILNQGETILRREDGMEYAAAGRYSAALILTDRRLILKRTLSGGAVAYPLSHLTKADIAEHRPSPFSLTNFHLLRLSFDNGGAVLFGMNGDKSAWIRAVGQAKSAAADMPYTTMPPEFKPSASAPRLLWIVAGLLGLIAGAACLIMGTISILLLMSSS